MKETQVQSLGREDPLKKGMTTPSSILAWRILWIEEPGRQSPWGLKKLDTTEQLSVISIISVISVISIKLPKD